MSTRRFTGLVAADVSLRRTTQFRLPRNPVQKSGLLAVGRRTSLSVPYLYGFSPQTCSRNGLTLFCGNAAGRPYVTVADHGAVNTVGSSTVNMSCKYLPR